MSGRSRRPDAGERQGNTDRAMRREVLVLAWPIATAMLGDVAMGLVDARLVGGLGANALAGVGIATTVLFIFSSLASGLMRGVKVSGSHAVGRQRASDALVYARAGVLAGVALGVLVWCFGRDAGWALTALQVEPESHALAREFLAARTWGTPFYCAMVALVQYRQAVGDTRSPMVVGVLGNVLNGALAYGLIYGHAGLPALGVAGAGYATATTEALEVVALLVLYARDVARTPRAAGEPGLFAALREVANIGAPTGVQFALEMLAFTAFTAVLGSVGAVQVAAHQVALAAVRVSFLPGFAAGDAASILVGRALGRGNIREADRAVNAGILISVAFMTSCGIVFALFGSGLASLLAPDAGVARVTAKLLLVAAVFQTMDAVTMALRSALRAARDVRVPPVIGVCVSWLCVPTAAFVFGRHFGMGAVGGWLGFVAETSISATLFWRRWRAGGWRAEYEISARTMQPDVRAPEAARAVAV